MAELQACVLVVERADGQVVSVTLQRLSVSSKVPYALGAAPPGAGSVPAGAVPLGFQGTRDDPLRWSLDRVGLSCL